MVKIPATCEGLPAIEQLIAEGINVNITLMFSVSQYEDVAQAYLRGIARARHPEKPYFRCLIFRQPRGHRRGQSVGGRRDSGGPGTARKSRNRECQARLSSVPRGVLQRAISEAEKPGSAPATAALGEHQHQKQSVLGCTVCRRPDRQDTINSVPPETLDAFRDHGSAKVTLTRWSRAKQKR